MVIVNPDIRYDRWKHFTFDEARQTSGLPARTLESQLRRYDFPVYSENGQRFLDRLDLGRVIYNGKDGRGRTEKKSIPLERHFTDGKTDPFSTVGEWEERYIEIRDKETKELVYSGNVEVPKVWLENTARIVASKYFFSPHYKEWKKKIEGRKESSPRQLYTRVSKFFGGWGERLGYFKTSEERQIFEDELNYLQINQMASFNSPVYFNAGIYEAYGIKGSPSGNLARDPVTGEVRGVGGYYERPQCHACFIAGPDDNLESIEEHAGVEIKIFTNGSGVGHDLSHIRAEGEFLRGGGRASGPMSWFEIYDTSAGTIKSGGKSRRAARMTTMRENHPDIMKFIRAKPRQDYIALTLMKAGFKPGFEGEAYSAAKFQNTNLSVRLSDNFFEQLEKDGEIEQYAIITGEVVSKIKARRMLQEIAFGSWRIGDPGVQYEDKIQEMHTCKNSGRINSSNPCSEYMFLDNTSCNLASLNLLKFADKKGKFNYQDFRKASRIMVIAQDIANDAGSYPSRAIATISPEFRTVGLGYANLGALLMRKGLPYDSEKARAFTSAITALMHGEANRTSTELAEGLGTFAHYELNKKPMTEVMEKHRRTLDDIAWDLVEHDELKKEVYKVWDEVIARGKKYGFRNAQVTVLAPTGTISWQMGCDTQGIEPALGLTSVKKLAGGGTLEFIVEEVPNALRNLGYAEQQIKDIVEYIQREKNVAGAPKVDTKHYAIFDTAYAGKPRGRAISFEGHVRMVAAAQPWVSGAISKTMNVPAWSTVKDIHDGYILGWKLGLKANATFRDEGKPANVLMIRDNENPFVELKRGEKREPPKTREGPHVEVKIGEEKFHVRANEYEDGTVCEIFVDAFEYGTTMGGILRTLAVSWSDALKRGVKLSDLASKIKRFTYEPNGITDHPYIRKVNSLPNFVGRWLELEYLLIKENAEDPAKVDVTKLRGFKNGAARIYRREGLNDWDVEQVLSDPEWGGFVPLSEEEKLMAVAASRNGSSRSGRMCKCGTMMQWVKANCFICPSCGDDPGSC